MLQYATAEGFANTASTLECCRNPTLHRSPWHTRTRHQSFILFHLTPPPLPPLPWFYILIQGVRSKTQTRPHTHGQLLSLLTHSLISFRHQWKSNKGIKIGYIAIIETKSFRMPMCTQANICLTLHFQMLYSLCVKHILILLLWAFIHF